MSALRGFTATFPMGSHELSVWYGYDVTAKSSLFFIKGSWDGSSYSSSQKMLNRIKRLKIDAFDMLISMRNLSVYGVSHAMEAESKELFDNIIENDYSVIDHAYDIYGLESEKDIEYLMTVFNSLNESNSMNTKLRKKYEFDRQMHGLRKSRQLLQLLRIAFKKGFVTPLANSPIKTYSENKLSAMYYKRDIDYIRKARVRVCRAINTKYTPF